MGRLIVVTTQDQVPGFRMAGVTVEAASSRDDVMTILRDVTDAQEETLVVVDESLIAEMEPEARREMEESLDPVVVAIPSPAGASAADRRARRAEFLRRALGFRITFPGEEE